MYSRESRKFREQCQSESYKEVVAIVTKIGKELRADIPTREQALVNLLNEEKFDLPCALKRNADENPRWQMPDVETFGKQSTGCKKKTNLKDSSKSKVGSQKQQEWLKRYKPEQFTSLDGIYSSSKKRKTSDKDTTERSSSSAKKKENKSNGSSESNNSLEKLQQLVENQKKSMQNLRFFNGMDTGSNNWIKDAFQMYIPITQSYMRNIGLCRITLSLLFESFHPTADQFETFLLLKSSVYTSLDALESQVNTLMNTWREYALGRPQKIFQLSENPKMKDLHFSILAVDDKLKLSIISHAATMVAGYSTIRATLKEVEDYTLKAQREDWMHR